MHSNEHFITCVNLRKKVIGRYWWKIVYFESVLDYRHWHILFKNIYFLKKLMEHSHIYMYDNFAIFAFIYNTQEHFSYLYKEKCTNSFITWIYLKKRYHMYREKKYNSKNTLITFYTYLYLPNNNYHTLYAYILHWLIRQGVNIVINVLKFLKSLSSN